jgi:putative membrane-bound dehydrogenase-like protein
LSLVGLLSGLLAHTTQAQTPAPAAPAKLPAVPGKLPDSPQAQPAVAAAVTTSPPASEMVRVPEGFDVVEFAGDDLAHDIYALTHDTQGRVVVAGAGYVKILVDRDRDGRAEAATLFSDSPKNGAQGLFFHGRSLLAMGDAGLLRYRDQNGDDVADGPPDVLIKFKTGGEHDAHAIQQGPDGWWYVIAGNTSEVGAGYASLPTSPVKQPRAGVVLRFRPDLAGGEILAEGLRNAYDFTFNGQGDLFTYDSDDERDISLPWYRPTRVFQILPGGDHGWISRSWKRPNYFFDMPPVLGSFGRGSPTGLACYRHTQFPGEYQGAIFALDWTYGRVLCLKPRKSGSSYTATADVFMSGLGGYGFAPTDLEIGPDGALYVSVGGRGTRGGVYRVTAKGRVAEDLSQAAPLDAILKAPQPLSSWSRAQWWAKARTMTKGDFVAAALETTRPAAERIRAIEIVTELFGGLDPATIHLMSKLEPPEVRARAIWSHGRIAGSDVDPAILASYLKDADPLVVRATLEATRQLGPQADWSKLVTPLAGTLGSDDRYVRQLAAMVVAGMPEALLPTMSQAATADGARAVVSYAAGWLAQVGGDLGRVRQAMSPVVVALLEGDYPPDLKLDALRLLQFMLGDLGPSPRHPAAFDAYAPGIDPDELERDWDELRIRLAELYPTGSPLIDVELSRVLAMLAPLNQKLLDRILAPITADSDPIDDLHQLLVAARLPVPRTTDERQRIATGLVQIDAKFAARKLPQDSAWNDRMTDLYKAHAALDEFLAPVMVDVPGFGRSGHVLFMSEMPGRRLSDAIAAFAQQIAADPDYRWTNDVIFLLGASSDPAHRELVREQAERFAVRGAVLMTLAELPTAEDRALFVAGLESSQPEVLQACLGALEKLPATEESSEQLGLLKALRRLGQDEREYVAREQVVKLLARNTGRQIPFVFGKAGYQPQTEAVTAWTQWAAERWPKETAEALGADAAGEQQLRDLLAQTDWSTGDVGRGAKLFETRSCAACHGGRSALGPDLGGVAGRFSKADLFTAIVWPSRDVSARYQTTIIQTVAGQAHAGLIVYESTDGLLLRNATHQTFRIETVDIEERRKSPVSLMPAGLLKDLTPRDYADLYAYLASLGASTNRGPATTAAGN